MTASASLRAYRSAFTNEEWERHLNTLTPRRRGLYQKAFLDIEKAEKIATRLGAQAPLFYIRCDTENGDNADLLVRANDAKEAKAMWRQWCKEADWECGEPMYVGRVPDTPAHGPIPWDDITGA
jgi:hypothetical protein